MNYFVLFGAKDRKIPLENATHQCPRCKQHDSVQLTRFENELIIFNKRIGLFNNMDVLYNCKSCHWKNKSLPDDDPCFIITDSSCDDELLRLPDIFVGSPMSNTNSFTSEDSVSAPLELPRRHSSASSWKQRLGLKRRAT